MRISDWSSDVCSSDLHLAGLDVDQVIVVRFGRGLVARTAVAEIMAIEDAGLLEQPHRAVDGRDRDARIDRRGALIDLLDIGMIVGVGEHARDDAALLGDAEALFVAPGIEIDLSRHSPDVMPYRAGSKGTDSNRKSVGG